MAPIKIERIVSVSSEDEAHPVSNLLKIDYSNKKWKCKEPGEKQISAVFQLSMFCKIISIDVGNEFSSFIEVLVGKSCSPDEDFKVLLVTSSLMTLQDSKYGTNTNTVTLFKEDRFCTPVCEEKWDRVKIVCTQPFNKHTQYGLSFIIFHTNTSQTTGSPSLGSFQMKTSTIRDPLLTVGGLFANREKLIASGALEKVLLLRAAAIRAASNSGDVNKFKKNSTEKRYSIGTDSLNVNTGKPRIQITPNEKKRNTDVSLRDDSPTTSRLSKNKNSPSTHKKKAVLATVHPYKKREERPFGNFMTNVVFALSGFQNPLRSELRSKALAMGAKYEANWNHRCTHLICAFRNTPKYNEVRGRGKIVKKDWIEDCYSRRIRIPWRRYALDNNDILQAESEEEIYELTEKPVSVRKRPKSSSDDDDGDTDDEIEKVRQKQKKLNGFNGHPSTSRAEDDDAASSSASAVIKDTDNNISKTSDNPSNSKGSDSRTNNINGTHPDNMDKKVDIPKKEDANIYDMDTESEDDNYWVKIKNEEKALPPLPPFLKDTSIALLDDISISDRKLLTRYIKAHQGCVASDGTNLNTVLYAITETLSAVERVREDFPQVMGVTPEWIWKSHDEGKLLPASTFKVT